MPVSDKKSEKVTCKIWDATQSDFVFPEQTYREITERNNVGLAFSGGGTRSASATLGYLRGLNELGLLSKVRYISCVSGSSLITTPFTYLPLTHTDETFLGKVVQPEDVTLDYLYEAADNSFVKAIVNANIRGSYVRQIFGPERDKAYARAFGELFLAPFGLGDDSFSRFFSFGDDTIEEIVRRNPDLNENDFHPVRAGRPFLIVSSILIRRREPRLIPFEGTSLYEGTKILVRDKDVIGGGYIEPFGFDSENPDQKHGDDLVPVQLTPGHRYHLSDMMGAAVAAPARYFAQFGLTFFGFPRFSYWPPFAPEIEEKAYNFGDHGELEKLGIMPLLSRKVERIIIFSNTQHALEWEEETEEVTEICASIPPLFDQSSDFHTNHVFPADQYEKLTKGLIQAKKLGKTVMFRDQYEVQENRFYGIEGGWEVDVLWVYNERVKDWEDELPPEIAQMIGTGSLRKFPHFRTVLPNPPRLIALTAEQANLLANLSCWNILENSETFSDMLT